VKPVAELALESWKSNNSASCKRGVRPRLAVLLSHPVQYYSPVLKALAEEIPIHVFYELGEKSTVFDKGFGVDVRWDTPLFEGYEYSYLPNWSFKPGADHFLGLISPGACSQILNWRPDAVLIYGWKYWTHLIVMRTLHRVGIPVLFRGDSTNLDVESAGLRYVARKRLLRWVYNHVDIALYVGSRNKEYFASAGLQNQQLVFAPHAVDNGLFARSLDRRSGLRQNLGIDDQDIAYLFVGKLEPRKAPDLLIEAFKRVDVAKTHLIVVGTGVMESWLRAQAGDRVHFVGFQNQSVMSHWYGASDVLVLPSSWGETWGLVINEAMASGLPIIASDKVGAAMDLVAHERNGYVFKSGDPASLADAMRRMITDNSRLEEMGKSSIEMIRSWSVGCQVAGIKTGLRIALNKRGRQCTVKQLTD
jgi:glycosyltransferase involved in cell wall biosynthesis